MDAHSFLSAFTTIFLLHLALYLANDSGFIWLWRTVAGVDLFITTLASLTLVQPYSFIFAIAATSFFLVAVKSFLRTS